MPSYSVAVPGAASSLVVNGSFGSSFTVDGAVANWATQITVASKTPTAITFNFSANAPGGGGVLDFDVSAVQPAASAPGVLLAGTIVNNVRDDIPDPVYDAGNNPQPDADGGVARAATLYRWLDQGVKATARKIGASLVEDWFAMPQVAFQPWYALDPKWVRVDAGFSNQWPLDTITMRESDAIWPTTTLTTSQSLFGFYRKRAAFLEFALWPVPTITDPSTTLVNQLAASGVDPIALTSTAGFLSYGYVQIDSEIIQYQRLATSPAGIVTISRGVCGTTAASHSAGATVRHLGLWVKGPRSPASITSSLSVIELSIDVQMVLETYLLARVRGSEQDSQEGKNLMADWARQCAEIRADPERKENAWQLRAFGEATVGPLIWGGQVIRP